MAERHDVDLADWPAEDSEAGVHGAVIVTSGREGLSEFDEEQSILAYAPGDLPPPVPAASAPRGIPRTVKPVPHVGTRSIVWLGATIITLGLVISGVTWSGSRRRTLALATASPPAAVAAPADDGRVTPGTAASSAASRDVFGAPLIGGEPSRPPVAKAVAPPLPPPAPAAAARLPTVDRPVVRPAPAAATGKRVETSRPSPEGTRPASMAPARPSAVSVTPPVAALDDAAPRLPPPMPPPAAVVPPVSDTPPRAAVETSAPVPPPLAPAATVTEKGAIESVLARYRDAFNTLDANKTGMFWPSVNTATLARVFDQLEGQEFTFDRCAIDVAGATAVATCRGRAAYTPRVGNRTQRVEARRWTFRLEKMNGVWVISRVDSARGGE